MSLNEPNIYVKLKGNREMMGTLVAFDEHVNLMMKDCEERIYSSQVDELTGKKIAKI